MLRNCKLPRSLLVQKIMLGYHMSKDTAIVMKLTRLVCRQQEKGKCYSSVIHGKYSSLKKTGGVWVYICVYFKGSPVMGSRASCFQQSFSVNSLSAVALFGDIALFQRGCSIWHSRISGIFEICGSIVALRCCALTWIILLLPEEKTTTRIARMQTTVILHTVFILILYSGSIINRFYRLPLRASNVIGAFDYWCNLLRFRFKEWKVNQNQMKLVLDEWVIWKIP